MNKLGCSVLLTTDRLSFDALLGLGGHMTISLSESTTVEPGHEAAMVRPATDTWRYLGDRDTADRAYCARFSVTEAPEPVSLQGGTLAYALPAAARRNTH